MASKFRSWLRIILNQNKTQNSDSDLSNRIPLSRSDTLYTESVTTKKRSSFFWNRKKSSNLLQFPDAGTKTDSSEEIDIAAITSNAVDSQNINKSTHLPLSENNASFNSIETISYFHNMDLHHYNRVSPVKNKKLGQKRRQDLLMISTAMMDPKVNLMSPISPFNVDHRSHYMAHLSGLGPEITNYDVASTLSANSFVLSGPSIFVPEKGPMETKVGRFTINRENVESSIWKPALKKETSRFSPIETANDGNYL